MVSSSHLAYPYPAGSSLKVFYSPTEEGLKTRAPTFTVLYQDETGSEPDSTRICRIRNKEDALTFLSIWGAASQRNTALRRVANQVGLSAPIQPITLSADQWTTMLSETCSHTW